MILLWPHLDSKIMLYSRAQIVVQSSYVESLIERTFQMTYIDFATFSWAAGSVITAASYCGGLDVAEKPHESLIIVHDFAHDFNVSTYEEDRYPMRYVNNCSVELQLLEAWKWVNAYDTNEEASRTSEVVFKCSEPNTRVRVAFGIGLAGRPYAFVGAERFNADDEIEETLWYKNVL